MKNSEFTIYTIGHSNHDATPFLDLLIRHSINILVDVRSIAGSSRFPQFNKASLNAFLTKNNVNYMHLPDEFGARRVEPEFYDSDGKVCFEKVCSSKIFLSGVQRLVEIGSTGAKISLMCSEGNPFDCHRFSMISRHLAAIGLNVLHILRDGTLITNQMLEEELLRYYGKAIPQPDLFTPTLSRKEQLVFAYKMRNKEIAFSMNGKQTIEYNNQS